MKKTLFCILTAAALLCPMTSALAETTTYEVIGNNVKSDAAQGQKTIIVTYSDETIVYIDQSEGTFDSARRFLMKGEMTPGEYKIKMSDGAKLTTRDFYVGAVVGAGDLQLTKIDGKQGFAEVKDENGNLKSYNVGYMAESSGSHSFITVIMKTTAGQYYAVTSNDPITVTGDNIGVGIQINTANAEDAAEIDEVWLSERTFDEISKLSKDYTSQGGSQ
ncbi:MAG: hypothetical protein PUD92_07735 [Clostridiales bacterium]|nr:hypothetical protein [Clostridiales bacterium]